MLSQTFDKWNEHDAPSVGAAMAFYTILSLAPLVIFTLALVGFMFGRSSAQNELLNQVTGMIGAQGADLVKGLIQHAGEPRSSAIASFIGGVTLLFGASGAFSELRSALNTMFDVDPKTESGLWQIVLQRIFSFGMVLAVGFLLLVSLLVSTALAALGKNVDAMLPASSLLLAAINTVVSFAGITVLFALIFRYVPATRIAWKCDWVGAMITTLLFTIGKVLIGFYLGKAAVGSAYGAAGSLIVVLVWVYYSAMIFLFGAEFTQVLRLTAAAGCRQQSQGA